MAIDTNKFCRDCPAFDPLVNNSAGLGKCRINPPVVREGTLNTVTQRNSVWPVVDDDDWCVFGRVLIDTGLWPDSQLIQGTLLGNYANDAAAAAGGVLVGQAYRNGSVVQVRVT